MDIIEYARGFMKSVDKVETMNKDYRPDGWETLKPTSKVLHCLNPEACVGSAYEAGASAMWDALWKLAEQSPTKTFTIDANIYRA